MTLGTNKSIIILVRNTYKLPRQAEKGEKRGRYERIQKLFKKKNKEYDKAEKMVDRLIDDTQSGIEDN